MKLVIDIPEFLLARIKSAKCIPDMYGSDIVNAVVCIRGGIPYEERPHGVWKKRTIGYLSIHECSNCDFNGDWLWNFCPNCGAKMQREW